MDSRLVPVVAVFTVLAGCPGGGSSPTKAVQPRVVCSDASSKDQDDMCIWVHPSDPTKSTVIAADKKADKIFVYDLGGKTLQAVESRHPGNIDLRQGVALGGRQVDLVALNSRDDSRLQVYQIDPDTRLLERIDDGEIRTGVSYGGTLYHDRGGKLYFFTTSKEQGVAQYELAADSAGKVKGTKVREWALGKCEGAVADDETGKVYVGEEEVGVWEIGARPSDPTPGKLVIEVGQNGLVADVEGLAIYRLPKGEGSGYLLVSNQGGDDFKAYHLESHQYAGTFAIAGAETSDGIAVANAPLGEQFPGGMFACHTARDGCPVLLSSWAEIAPLIRGAKRSD